MCSRTACLTHHVKEVTPLHALCGKVAVVRKLHHAVGVLVVAVGDQQQQLSLDGSTALIKDPSVSILLTPGT